MLDKNKSHARVMRERYLKPKVIEDPDVLETIQDEDFEEIRRAFKGE